MIADDTMIEKVIDSGLDLLVVSLDGATDKTAKEYQDGIEFKKVFLNMKKMISERNKLGKKYPKVVWRYILNKYNEKEVEHAVNLSKKEGIDEIELNTLLPNMATYNLKSERESFDELKDWMPEDKKYCLFNKITMRKNNYTIGCNWLWLMSTINWNGSVSPCCGIWFEKFDFGNVSKNKFSEVWNNKKYQEARRAILGKKSDEKNICSICKKNKAQI